MTAFVNRNSPCKFAIKFVNCCMLDLSCICVGRLLERSEKVGYLSIGECLHNTNKRHVLLINFALLTIIMQSVLAEQRDFGSCKI